MSDRICEHGWLKRQCPACDLRADLAAARAEIARLQQWYLEDTLANDDAAMLRRTSRRAAIRRAMGDE